MWWIHRGWRRLYPIAESIVIGDHHHCYHIAIVTQMLFIHELDMLQSWIRNDMIFLKKHPIRRSEALRLGCFFKMGLLFWFITLGCPAEYYVRGRVLLSLKTEKEEDSLLPKNCQPSVTVQPHGQPKPSTSFRDIFQLKWWPSRRSMRRKKNQQVYATVFTRRQQHLCGGIAY